MSDIETDDSDIRDSNGGDRDEAQIRDLAYELWEGDGRPEGKPDEYWYRARQVLAHTAHEHGEPRAGEEPEPAYLHLVETAAVG